MSDSKNTKDAPASATEAFEQALAQQDNGYYVFRLFVAGLSAQSLRAIENIQALCAEHLPGRFELEIIDIYQQPMNAQESQIIAAPTLVKELPPPLRKFIGDLSHTDKLLAGLDVRKKDPPLRLIRASWPAPSMGMQVSLLRNSRALGRCTLPSL